MVIEWRDIIEQIKSKMTEIVESIMNSELYLNFMACAEKVESHEEINDLRAQIKHLQKQRVNSNFLEKVELTTKLTTEIDDLHARLEAIPLYMSFVELKEELESIVAKVSVAIETSLNKNT